MTGQGLPAVILAGGRARRMGGADKGLMDYRGAPLLCAVIARIAPQAGPLAINANGDPARFAAFGLPVLPDPLPDQPGPLAGVLAAMDWAAAQGASRVVTVPCDTPELPPGLVAGLAAQTGLVLAQDDADRHHPTIALWPTALAPALRAALAAGARKVMDFAQGQGARAVRFPRAQLINLNTPAELAAAARPFDTILIVDWSGGADRGPRPKRDAIWAFASPGTPAPVYLRNRQVAEGWLRAFLQAELAAGRRVLAGFDFPFAAPQGFAAMLTGQDDPLALWDWLEAALPADAPAAARFDLAGRINARFPGVGPFWGNGLRRDVPDLPRKGNARTYRWAPERRAAEHLARGAFPIWQLSGAGSVGSQMLTGLPVLARLRHHLGDQCRVWPFQSAAAPVTLAEVWPSLLAGAVAAATRPGDIRDAVQVRLLAQTLAALPAAGMAALVSRPSDPEGWIFGLGHETELQALAQGLAAVGPDADRAGI